MNLDEEDIMDKKDTAIANLENTDKWILSRMNTIVAEVNHNMTKYELGIAASKIYDFAWNEYCDWYIELVKPVYTARKNRPRFPLSIPCGWCWIRSCDCCIRLPVYHRRNQRLSAGPPPAISWWPNGRTLMTPMSSRR